MAQQRDNRGPDPITIFVLMSIGFVVIAMIGFVVLLILGRTNAQVTIQQDTMPYDIILRPTPSAQRAVDLLPEKLGAFKRGPVTGTISQYQATYTNGKDKIDISGSREVSFRAAQYDVSQINQTNSVPNVIQHQVNQNPSFILTGGTGPVRFIWSIDRWFFDVKASSQAALDAFMAVFKY